MSRRREDGVAVVLAVGLIAVLFLVAGIGGGAVAIIAAHRDVQGAADLAALAAASAAGSGAPPCSAARLIAARNGDDVTRCEVDGREVLVTVARRLPRVLGDRVVRARARAGPVPGAE